MSHTPGPWINDASHPEWERNVVWAGDVVVARVVDDQHGNADANARLISAAPDLLAAARLANQELIDIGQGSSGSPALVALWAAIAKAEGRE